MKPRARLQLACAVTFLVAPPLAAQSRGGGAPGGWEGAALLGVNVAATGAAAALAAWVRGEDVSDALMAGAAGGALGWAGKRIAVEPFDGAGLLGREVAAVGHSMATNASAGRAPLEQVWLPFGPLEVRATGGTGFPLRAGLGDLVMLAWAATREELRMDWGLSLSNGTAIFTAPGHHFVTRGEEAVGLASGSVVLIGAGPDPERTRGHEMVHVIQHDAFRALVSNPFDRWAVERLFGIDPPVLVGLVPGALSVLPWAPVTAAFEWEADLWRR